MKRIFAVIFALYNTFHKHTHVFIYIYIFNFRKENGLSSHQRGSLLCVRVLVKIQLQNKWHAEKVVETKLANANAYTATTRIQWRGAHIRDMRQNINIYRRKRN